MIREEDREVMRRVVRSIIAIENTHFDELRTILVNKSLSIEERADRYVDKILDHLEYVEED